jgi:hypothetical protein
MFRPLILLGGAVALVSVWHPQELARAAAQSVFEISFVPGSRDEDQPRQEGLQGAEILGLDGPGAQPERPVFDADASTAIQTGSAALDP